MVFSSVEFIFIFLPVCLAGYYLIGKKHRTARNAFLLVMSLAFYASGEPKFVLVMMLSIAVNYAMALLFIILASEVCLIGPDGICIMYNPVQ